jgi:hypothetical protein
MPTRATAIVVMVIAAVAACVGSAAPPTPGNSPSPRASPAIATDAPNSEPSPDGPPAARLAAEGGDPVAGQLGTYVWGDAGSDSPWLPGAPISVGVGEPLALTFDPAIPVSTWRARMVPADAAGPDGASPLGQGAGDPRFGAPAPGSWTAEVHVEFVAGRGDASYFWRLDVS